ncbi:MAG: prenyltransferase/squalene oxidase repeat-containing protein, partial [Patescibacteria group bacterium]|nr:prenyltransferase/squalene oxidase repeat-containing protein [Patescibacteria group bacterium]
FGNFAPSRATINPAVGAYLASVNPQTDWSIMARAALGGDIPVGDASFLKELDGDTANDYATYILAIAALGEDPRSFGSENLVYGLRQKVSNGQIGDATLLSDDMFGLLALSAAGVPANDALITQTINYIKTKQLSDGGWDWSASATESSVDYTAMAIMALVGAGVSPSDDVVFNAGGYLVMAQNDDGGFPIAPGGASNTASTAWALSALHAMGDDPNFFAPGGKTPIDYLNARLHESGYFLFNAQSASSDQFTPIATSYAAIALAGKAYPVASITAPPTVSLRIEGTEQTICDTQAQGKTALDVIKSAAGACGYSYVIEDTQYGPYLSTIAGEAADPVTYDGWSYLPNYELAQVGASNWALLGFAVYMAGVFLLAFLSNTSQKGKSFMSEYFL